MGLQYAGQGVRHEQGKMKHCAHLAEDFELHSLSTFSE
jgi:hypothetical protein